MKTVSEQEKVRQLATLHKDEVGTASYSFIQFTLITKAGNGTLGSLTEKQQKWFDDLYEKHFEKLSPEDIKRDNARAEKVFQQRQGKFNPKDDEGY